jgi:D-serine deaminase-like pyridoxal phosphate-dependent protein
VRRALRTVHDLPTPALLVDIDALSANVARMAAHARAIGVQLRPHFKTHKSVEIARLQRDAGAVGFTVATPHEAETLVAAGFDDVLVAHSPVGTGRAQRLAALRRRARVAFVIDSLDGARALAESTRGRDGPVRVLWEVDCGTARCGTAPGSASAAGALEVAALPGIEVDGFLTFPGHAYAAADEAQLDTVVGDEERAMAATSRAARELGAGGATLSGGSTPTASRVRRETSLSELRPGNYVFHDATQIALGVASREQCALTVLATVVARPTPHRAILDTGSKALGAERMTARTHGFAHVAARPELAVTRLYEEHGVIEADDPFSRLSVGARVEVLPNHACVTANLHESYVLRRGEDVVDVLALGARGWR